MKKKILHILSSNSYSGAENVAITIINECKKDYEFAYCSPQGPISKNLEENEIIFIPVKKISIIHLQKIVNKYKPDIIHAHDYRASTVSALLHFKGRVISHIHCNAPFMKKLNPKSLFYKLCTKRFFKIIAPSIEIFEEMYCIKKIRNKTEVSYNFIDKSRILSLSKVEKKDNYDIFYFGRLSQEKGIINFINIIKLIKNKTPNIKAVVIGGGPLENECKELISKYNLFDNVLLVGFQKNPYTFIRKSKFGIMPSIYEGFGLTAIEAMSLGKPVLNSGAGGFKSIFKNNSEFICKNQQDFYEKSILLLTENDKYNQFSQKSIKIANRYSSLQEWKKLIENNYN